MVSMTGFVNFINSKILIIKFLSTKNDVRKKNNLLRSLKNQADWTCEFQKGFRRKWSFFLYCNVWFFKKPNDDYRLQKMVHKLLKIYLQNCLEGEINFYSSSSFKILSSLRSFSQLSKSWLLACQPSWISRVRWLPFWKTFISLGLKIMPPSSLWNFLINVQNYLSLFNENISILLIVCWKIFFIFFVKWLFIVF